MNKKIILYIVLALIISIVIVYYNYIIINSITPNADTNLAARNIETTAKLILNGYLGSLFGFKFLGNINWLIIPLFIIYMKLIKPIFTASKKAFILLFILAFGLIAAKGFFNPRYQLTLLPVLIYLVFYFNWCIFEHLNQKILRYVSSIFILLFVFFNFYIEVFGTRFQEKLQTVIKTENKPIMNEEQDDLYVEDVLVYIENMKTNRYFLINNLPDFYYQTNKKGHYYWCGDDTFYSATGKQSIFNNQSDSDAKEFLLKKMNCKYIYTYKPYANYNNHFDTFIEKNCKLLVRDELKLLYEIIPDEE